MLTLDEVKIEAVSLSPAAEHKVDVLIRTLKDVDEVTKTLQRPGANIRSVHAYFDTVFEYYPCLLDLLDFDVQIV